MRASNTTALVFGLILIVLGIGFLLNSFNLIPANWLQLWPVLVMAAGGWLLAQGVRRRGGGGLVGGVVLLALGGLWLLQNFGQVDDRLLAPVLLIAIGAGLLLRSLAR